ncbi:hypothetical protein WA026_003154 [Henosepilachna vigintioctopunctata]|uniref:Uncharacterized protein n=1 Tax=Henosepilachna vigintioctopunctata TaxID=420089 RepID=A0AAW1TLH0_9CUCU
MNQEEATSEPTRKTFSIERLVELSESPLCLEPPKDWEQISQRLPAIVKSKVEPFQGKEYLEKRKSELTSVKSCENIGRKKKNRPEVISSSI